ncbi:sensor histidine kinase [Streptomyces sp. NPDC015350]|uniref:sensor histidine kinase n=1 Tax=Streptomyces sp. NPDC015350 TaxID=3364955 RepID=UPI0036FDEB96
MVKRGGSAEADTETKADTDMPSGAAGPSPASGSAWLFDAALWVVPAGAGLWAFRSASQPSVVRDVVLPFLVLAVAVPASRRWPGASVFAANGLCALGLANESTPANAYVLALAAMTYLMGARVRAGRVPLVVLTSCLAFDLALCAVLGRGAIWWFYAVTMLPAALLVPWLVGRYQQARRALVSGGWRLARTLEERQRFVAEQARLRERTRIAADMHDSLGHVLSLIALRAGALELSPTLGEQDREDVAELRRTVSEAVDHLRETVTVLRDGPGGGPEGSSVESVEELLERAAASGVAVDLVREGDSPSPSPLVGHAVYRVVQESLTNATKHAPGSSVRVRIVHEGGRTEVGVTNSASPAGPSPGPVPGNRGLAGLRERVGALGGVLHAGPFEQGFRVTAVLPDRVGGTRPDPVPQPPPDDGAESARRMGDARRRVRLRFAVAFVAPAALALAVLPSAGYLAYQLATCILPPTSYAAVQVGRERAEFAHLLPVRSYPYPPDTARSAPRPYGSECEFYRSNGNLLDQVDLYRLCFSGDRLVAKDVVPGGGPGGS